MHELYMLAIVFNASRSRATELTRAQRQRAEQAFYERHGGSGWPRFRRWHRLAAVPVAVVAFGLMVEAARLLLH